MCVCVSVCVCVYKDVYGFICTKRICTFIYDTELRFINCFVQFGLKINHVHFSHKFKLFFKLEKQVFSL